MWVEEYDLRQAPDRWVRRKMEAENKKKRDVAKSERNQEIRVCDKNLFSYINCLTTIRHKGILAPILASKQVVMLLLSDRPLS